MSVQEKKTLTIELTRVFPAPRDLVFRMWTDPEHLNKWCRPENFTVTASGGDIRPGGAWHSTITSPEGENYRMAGEYQEIVENEKIAFTHQWHNSDGSRSPERLITVTLEDAPEGGTRLTFVETPFDDREAWESNGEGWSSVLDSLGDYLKSGS